MPPLYDAHNHLQDDRFGRGQAELVEVCRQIGVARMVVNGSSETDWPQVLELAHRFPIVLPSFGYHPWHLQARTPDWRRVLVGYLDRVPSAIGEVGLDRWKPGLEYAGQEEVFLAQLELAAERDLPVSIHCLQAWGRLHRLLQDHPRPRRGFLLHSYGGPREMVEPLARLGAYFGFPGYFLRERKARQRAVFLRVPPERFLVETDAPDQPLPDAWNRYPLPLATAQESPEGEARPDLVAAQSARAGSLNHPANLGAVYEFAAAMLGESLDGFAARVEENFHRLFDR